MLGKGLLDLSNSYISRYLQEKVRSCDNRRPIMSSLSQPSHTLENGWRMQWPELTDCSKLPLKKNHDVGLDDSNNISYHWGCKTYLLGWCFRIDSIAVSLLSNPKHSETSKFVYFRRPKYGVVVLSLLPIAVCLMCVTHTLWPDACDCEIVWWSLKPVAKTKLYWELPHQLNINL